MKHRRPLLLPTLPMRDWVLLNVHDTKEVTIVTLVPLESDYTCPTTYIETQWAPFRGDSFPLDEFVENVRSSMVAAGLSDRVDVETTGLSPSDVLVSFAYTRDPIVSPLTEVYRLAFVDGGMLTLTIASQRSDSPASGMADALLLARSSDLHPITDFDRFAPADMNKSQHQRQVRRVATLVGEVEKTDAALPVSKFPETDPYELPPDQYQLLADSIARKEGLGTLKEYLDLLQKAATSAGLLEDVGAWLKTRFDVVTQGLRWVQEDTLANRADVRLAVIEALRDVCQHSIDVAYLLGRRTPGGDVKALIALGEFRILFDLCLTILRATPVEESTSRTLDGLRAAAKDDVDRVPIDIIRTVTEHLRVVQNSDAMSDPGSLWEQLAATHDRIALLHALNDIGATLLATGRFATDVAWQTACAVVDTASVIDLPADVVRSDQSHMDALVRCNALQQVASCYASGITTAQLDYLARHAHSDDSSQSKGLALFLRNLRDVRRYVLPNRFAGVSSVKTWPIEPPRMTLEAMLERGLPSGVARTAIGGAYDALGMGRSLIAGGDWRGLVASLLSIANFVILIPSPSEGILWEAKHLVEQDLLEHTVWVMPPEEAEPSGRREWTDARAALVSLGIHLPEFHEGGGFILVDRSGKPRHEIPFDHLWSGRFGEAVSELAWRNAPSVP